MVGGGLNPIIQLLGMLLSCCMFVKQIVGISYELNLPRQRVMGVTSDLNISIIDLNLSDLNNPIQNN